MAVHPPFLYLGYVGMTIPFGLACAALLTGRLGHDFLRPLRTWLLLPWTFLTVAIVLGGWWAYEVLGWGGYWAWDPVENASFLPWLTATAALHSALLDRAQGRPEGLDRHAGAGHLPAHDPRHLHDALRRLQLGPLLHAERDRPHDPGLPGHRARLLGGAARASHRPPGAPRARSSRRAAARRCSSSTTCSSCCSRSRSCSGTVFPLVVEAARGVQMSVGRPYFDRMAVPLGVALLLPDGRRAGAAVGPRHRRAGAQRAAAAARRRRALRRDRIRARRAQAVDARRRSPSAATPRR